MRWLALALVSVIAISPACSQENSPGPSNEKAQKTYKQAMDDLHGRQELMALENFKKADKQDGGHCVACQKEMIKHGLALGDWKAAELGAEELVGEAQGDKDIALAHYRFARVLVTEAMQRHKDEIYTHAHEEVGKAFAAFPNFPDAYFLDGKILGSLGQDDAAKASFEKFLKMSVANNPDRQRAQRYIARPELCRARMAPPFTVNTVDGKSISMDDLQGKVVLIDFWATWCAPCREALPHIQNVAKKFQGEPLVILSVSLDSDEQKWKDFITKNEMTWPQYRDGGFSGAVAKMFGVEAIPHTFTIDADGVLQDEHIGDASIEGKLKKLIAHARELQTSQQAGK
jgi:peroxiredoxin/predicted negative regulator of RcsB-dependent stress response